MGRWELIEMVWVEVGRGIEVYLFLDIFLYSGRGRFEKRLI